MKSNLFKTTITLNEIQFVYFSWTDPDFNVMFGPVKLEMKSLGSHKNYLLNFNSKLNWSLLKEKTTHKNNI